VFRYIMGGLGNVPPGPPSGEDIPEFEGQVDLPELDGPLPELDGHLHESGGPLPELDGHLQESGGPLPVSGVQGGTPLTMDMFSAQLHIKKREFIDRMATAASIPKKLKINYKLKIIKK